MWQLICGGSIGFGNKRTNLGNLLVRISLSLELELENSFRLGSTHTIRNSHSEVRNVELLFLTFVLYTFSIQLPTFSLQILNLQSSEYNTQSSST